MPDICRAERCPASAKQSGQGLMGGGDQRARPQLFSHRGAPACCPGRPPPRNRPGIRGSQGPPPPRGRVRS
eukprot:287927-Lingulodinium_polyedra.AAC.1